MKSISAKIAITVLVVGLLAACGSETANTPVVDSQPTAAVSVTAAPTEAPVATATSLPTESTAATEPAASGATVSFANDILPLLDSRCINCHGGNRTEKGLDLKTYAGLLSGSENGTVLTPGDAAHSHLIELIASGKMPKRGPKLTPEQVQLITDWVNQGALNN